MSQGTCNLSGHAERGCAGMENDRSYHLSLCKDGVGFSTVPGPSDREIAVESLALSRTRFDHELDADD